MSARILPCSALVTQALHYRSEVLEDGQVVQLVAPTKTEQKRLDELADRSFPDPCVVALWERRARLVPQHSIRPLDDAADRTMRRARRKAPKP